MSEARQGATATSVPRSRWFRWLAGFTLLAGVVGSGYLVWYVFLRPPEASGVAGSALAIPTLGASASVAQEVVDDGDGVWTVNTDIGSFNDFTSSFVGYRVQEELAGIGGNTAVGRTPDVSGSLTVEDHILTEATISADLTTLASDDERRDNSLRRQALESERFPTASFALTEPIALPDLGEADGVQQATIRGELTLHGVTRPVDIAVRWRLNGGVLVLAGSVDVAFADYGIDKPQSMIVLSVADHATLEFQLYFTQAEA